MKGEVVYVAPYFPPDLGGVERLAEQLAMCVAAHRKVTVLTSSAEQAGYVPPEYPPSMEVRRLRTWRVAQVPFMPGLLPELLRTSRRSILHVHVAQAFAPEVVWLVSRLMRRPFVAHFHLDVPPSTRLGPLFVLYKRVVLSRVLRAATRVVVLSSEQARLVENRYGIEPRRIAIVANGVSPEFLTAARRPDLEHGPLRLLFVGRLSPQKNLPRLLDAVVAARSEVELAIVGGGPEAAAVRDRIRTLGLDRVRMVGAQQGAALRDWYGWADVLVLTSDQEGMPLVLLEAMASGLPVVATDVPGVRSTLGDAGLIVTPTAAAVAAAIDELAADPARREELARLGRRRVRAYEWDHIVDAIDHLYEAVAG